MAYSDVNHTCPIKGSCSARPTLRSVLYIITIVATETAFNWDNSKSQKLNYCLKASRLVWGSIRIPWQQHFIYHDVGWGSLYLYITCTLVLSNAAHPSLKLEALLNRVQHSPSVRPSASVWMMISSSERSRRARAMCGTDGRMDGTDETLLASSRILPLRISPSPSPSLSLSLPLSVVSCCALFGSCDICSFAAGAEAHNLPREAPPPPHEPPTPPTAARCLHNVHLSKEQRERERGKEGKRRAAARRPRRA